MSNIQIEQVDEFPIDGFEELMRESVEEGFRFLERLKDEWEKGINSFRKEGEALYRIKEGKELVGIGGINNDPYDERPRSGRLRRFYIKKSRRGQKLGKKLLLFMLEKHKRDFDRFALYTDTQAAAAFYEKHGFERVENVPKVSHEFFLSS